MALLSEKDMSGLLTDSTITYTTSDGRQQQITPIRQTVVSRQQPTRYLPPSATPARPIASSHSTSSGMSISQAGTPVSVATQLKPMAPPALPHPRISNGGMRVPSVPAINMQASPPPPSAVAQTNGAHDVNAHVDATEHLAKSPALQSPHARQGASPVQQPSTDTPAANTSPMRAKPQPAQAITVPTVPNGYHIPTVNAYSTIPNATYMHAGSRANGLTLQQMKAAYASMSPPPDTSAQVNNPNLQLRTPTYLTPTGHSNYPQFANVRPMQWATAAVAQQQHQQRALTATTADTNAAESMPPPAMSPPMPPVPVRTPSANGMRTPMSRNMAVPGAHMGQPQGRASPANPHMAARMAAPLTPSPHLLNSSLAATQVQGSPTRSPQPPMASPSLQARQVVSSSGAGY